MKASDVVLKDCTSVESILDAIEAIETDRRNYDGNWFKGDDVRPKAATIVKLLKLNSMLDGMEVPY
jgi:hypothetical protein